MTKQHRTEFIRIRVTPAELQRITDEAEKLGGGKK